MTGSEMPDTATVLWASFVVALFEYVFRVYFGKPVPTAAFLAVSGFTFSSLSSDQ